MRQAFFLIVILSSLSVVYSQHNDSILTNESDSIVDTPGILADLKPVKNALKTDLLSWVFNVGVLKYERVFSEKISAQLGFIYSWDFPAYDEGYAATGFGISPELRYYLMKKKRAPRDLYMAPNYRYQKLETENWGEQSTATVTTNSIALNLGYQLVLKDLILFDGWLGLAYNFRKVTDETVPGAETGYNDENEFGPRAGISIGLVF